MNARAELEALIRTQIEEPAGRQILDMVRAGRIEKADADLFGTSADRYKAAVLAEYESFDPRVRDELRKSLLTDYQNEIDRLIKDIAARAVVSAPQQKQIDETGNPGPTQTGQPDQKEEHRSVASSLLGRARRYLFPGNPRSPQ
jgi:hypothetical protein